MQQADCRHVVSELFFCAANAQSIIGNAEVAAEDGRGRGACFFLSRISQHCAIIIGIVFLPNVIPDSIGIFWVGKRIRGHCYLKSFLWRLGFIIRLVFCLVKWLKLFFRY